MYDRKIFCSAQNVTDVSFFVVTTTKFQPERDFDIARREQSSPIPWSGALVHSAMKSVRAAPLHYKKRHICDILGRTNFFFCHTYDTSMTIIVTKHGIIIDVVGSYFYDNKS